MNTDIHQNDLVVGDMVQKLDMKCYGIITESHADDAGSNFHYVLWTSGDELVDPPFIDIAWESDLRLMSRGINNEKR